MKKGLIMFIILGILLINLVIAAETQMEDTEFNKYLEEFNKNSVFSDEFLGKISSMTMDQKIRTVFAVTLLTDQGKFWEQWKTIEPGKKNFLLKGVNPVDQGKFLEALGKNYGAEFKGFNGLLGTKISFGEGGVIGNENVFFDYEKVKSYNSGVDEKNKVKLIEYIEPKGDVKEGLSFSKNSGAKLELIPGKDKGFYFDVETGNIYKLNRDEKGNLNPDPKDSLSGTWNGNGILNIDSSGEKTKITLDTLRDEKGKIKDVSNFATYKTSSGDSYSLFDKPVKDGSKIEKSEITFNSDGKPDLLSNVYYENSKLNGFFGKDVKVYYSKEEFDKLSDAEKAKLGSYFIIDEKNKYIGGDVARVQSGVGKVFSDSLEKMQAKVQKSLSELTSKDAVKKYGTSLGINLDSVIDAASPAFIAAKLSKDWGIQLPVSHEFVKYLASPDGQKFLKAYLPAASNSVKVAQDLTSFVLSKIDSPLLVANKPADGTYMNVQLKNEFAKSIQNIDLRSGSLDMFDSNGKLVNIIKSATPYSYQLASDVNRDNPSFSGINFNLVNSKIPDYQLQVYSDDSGRLQTPLDNGNLVSVGSRAYSGTGDVSLGPRGRIHVSQTEGIVQFGMNANPESVKAASAYLEKEGEEYRTMVERYTQLYKSYTDANRGVEEFSPEQMRELQPMYDSLKTKANEITLTHYSLLAKGNSQIYLNSLTSNPQEFADRIYNLGNALESFASQEGSGNLPIDSASKQMLLSTAVMSVLSDRSAQDSLAQRGLTSVSEISGAVNTELASLAQFLKSTSGTSIVFSEDSKNNKYTISYGGKSYNVDPVLAPAISSVLPMIIGSGGVQNGQFYINTDVWNSNRLMGDKSINLQAYGWYKLLYAAKHKAEIKEDMRGQISSQLINSIMVPN
ncbi:hypothetical protein J4218_04645 [Candidatus Pacearchaeota archaeon]|nr:hypothetical protein [Candidatus Pacearchaeota archaeon]